jgi:hypothetical protein
MPEKDFLEWINSEAMNSSEIPNNSDTIYRQAAIDAIAELTSSMSVCISVDECHGMKRMQGMAVRALEGLPSAQPEKRTEKRTETPARDCISRQAAIRIASGYCHPANIAAELAKLPPAQPDRKTAHWIEGRTDDPKTHNILCSNCFEGYPSRGHANSSYTSEKFKYCPHCGAIMIELQENEKVHCESTKCKECINHNYCDYEPHDERSKRVAQPHGRKKVRKSK